MNISLSSELERFVRESVASGRYKSASEVVREALRLLQEKDHSTAVAELRQRQVRFDVAKSQFVDSTNSNKKNGTEE